ncbi:MAG: PilZ domain-containing protein [Deltaproteobacteria bacterium]|nr:PilZ domain-containing protein [Deltaproteobacteria bacterium]
MAKKSSKRGGADRRRFPRKATVVKVRLEASSSRGMIFEASLPSRDVSIGGVFLESEFFVKLGSELEVRFELPGVDEPVHVKGAVIREQRGRGDDQRSGFAIEFTNFYEDAEQALATYFLAPEVNRFVQAYRRRGRHRRIRNDEKRMVDLVVAWELDQLAQGRGRIIA